MSTRSARWYAAGEAVEAAIAALRTAETAAYLADVGNAVVDQLEVMGWDLRRLSAETFSNWREPGCMRSVLQSGS